MNLKSPKLLKCQSKKSINCEKLIKEGKEKYFNKKVCCIYCYWREKVNAKEVI